MWEVEKSSCRRQAFALRTSLPVGILSETAMYQRLTLPAIVACVLRCAVRIQALTSTKWTHRLKLVGKINAHTSCAFQSQMSPGLYLHMSSALWRFVSTCLATVVGFGTPCLRRRRLGSRFSSPSRRRYSSRSGRQETG